MSETARDSLDVLRGFLICALVVTAGTGEGELHAAFRATLPSLAGLGLGVALAGATGVHRPVPPLRWVLHFGALWLATFSGLMWGNREVLRTSAVAGVLAIAWRARGRARACAIALPLVVAAVVATAPSSYWLRVASGDLLYAVGGGWPRGWTDVSRDGALFLAGYAAAGGSALLAVAAWRSATEPFRALGRMPLTALATQYVLSPVTRADALLVAQIVFAVLWLRTHGHGPCEQIVRSARTTAWRMRHALAAAAPTSAGR
jgi:uncharacterized membrane protein YeiB